MENWRPGTGTLRRADIVRILSASISDWLKRALIIRVACGFGEERPRRVRQAFVPTGTVHSNGRDAAVVELGMSFQQGGAHVSQCSAVDLAASASFLLWPT